MGSSSNFGFTPVYNWNTGQYTLGGQNISFSDAISWAASQQGSSVQNYNVVITDWYQIYEGGLWTYLDTKVTFEENNRSYSNYANQGGGVNFSLAGMYMHFQIGGGNPMYINASSIDFSGTNQRQLGLDKIGIGKTLDPVNLFNAGINSNSLAFGKLSMTRVSETQFSIAPNMFDFDYQSDASWQRNAGTILGGMINYNLFPGAPFSPLVPLIFGGPYNVIFNGTVTIPK